MLKYNYEWIEQATIKPRNISKRKTQLTKIGGRLRPRRGKKKNPQ